nr:hypothetical protein [uncultured Desulfobacter sp.]
MNHICCIAGHENDPDIQTVFSDNGEQVFPIDLGHDHVGEQQINAAWTISSPIEFKNLILGCPALKSRAAHGCFIVPPLLAKK